MPGDEKLGQIDPTQFLKPIVLSPKLEEKKKKTKSKIPSPSMCCARGF